MKSRFLLALAILTWVVGCGPQGPEYINPTIAGHYQEFYELGTTQPEASLKALDQALTADPENAYTLYLKASAHAQMGDFKTADQVLKDAESKERILHYVTAAPPDDPMSTLNRFRQLGFTAAKADLGEATPQYLQRIRQAAKRVAGAEPVASLGVIAANSVIRNGFQAEVAYYRARKKQAELETTETKLKAFEAWTDAFQKDLAATVANIIEEAGKAAGLTDDEKSQISRNIPLKDSAKQAKAEAAREKIIAEEVAALRRNLEKMPAL